MCPFTSLPSDDGPNRFSPGSVTDWQPPRKSVNNACERCRRRKIRCDSDTPCATCKRFSLPCVRTQKPREVLASEHQAALESRIHQLEAQLSAHVNAPMHGMETIDQNLMAATPSAFDWQSPPQLTVDTNFSTPWSPENELNFSAGSIPSMPSIAITECEPSPNAASPCSPVPSFWSGTTRASSPEVPPTSAAFAPRLAFPDSTSKPFSPLAAPHTAPSWEFMAGETSDQLKPEASDSRGHSRRTSVSSFSLDSEEQGMSSVPEAEDEMDIGSLAPAPRLPRQGIFAPQTESPPSSQPRSAFTDRSRAITTTPFPSRFEAETLTTEFVQHLESLEHKVYNMTPAMFRCCCEAVYPDTKNRMSGFEMSVSMQMARFHVFAAMAVGMKVRIRDSPESTNSLLDTCYDLAMQQASSATFWQESGAVEAAQLLAVFASVRKTHPSSEPKRLQQSFSW